MKRYIKPNIEMIEMPSILLFSTSREEGSQVPDAMSNKNDGDFESDMDENTSLWLKSDSYWDEDIE